jgi:glycine cleavage system H lipoate-binding protein
MSEKCPFLEETAVHFCAVSPVRKLVPDASIDSDGQRCSSAGWTECPLAGPHPNGHGPGACCPFLHASHVQHCKAAAATVFVPCNDALRSRCNSSAHRYCNLFLEQLHGGGATPLAPGAGVTFQEDIPVPGHLVYTRNHLWLDRGPDGACHVGADAFLARVLGQVERVSFISTRGARKPMAVVRAAGVDLTLAFPRRLEVTAVNTELTSHPERLVEDPYGTGWLFERVPTAADAGAADSRPACGMIDGSAAGEWIRGEIEDLSRFVGELPLPGNPERLAADGGIFVPGVASQLHPEDLLFLFNTFFSTDRARCLA